MAPIVKIEIDDSTYNALNSAVNLNKTTIESVITDLTREYCANTFSNVANKLATSNYKNKISNKKEIDFCKAKRKIPSWSVKPHLNTHKIIKAFFEIEAQEGIVTTENLENKCSDKNVLETYVPKFTQNFAQMKIDNGNSNGKVFETINGIVFIWDEIRETLLKHKSNFTSHSLIEGTNEQKPKKAITQSMLTKAYEIGKKIHLGFLNEKDGSTIVNIATSMPTSLAEIYIDFIVKILANEKPVDVITPEAARYFLEKIRDDFSNDKYNEVKMLLS